MSVSKEQTIKYQKRLKNNIPFLISAVAAGMLMFFSVTDFADFIVFLLAMLVVSVYFEFDLETLRESMAIWKIPVALVLLICISQVFFAVTVNSYKLQAITESAGFDITVFSLILTVLIAVFAAYFVLSVLCFLTPKTDLQALYSRIRDRFLSFQNIKKVFIAVFLIYLLAVSAILMADISYLDDMRRIAFGFPGWEDCSRYLSNILSQLINTNSYLADISPLTQIIALLFLAAASLIVICAFSADGRISAWSVIAVLPLGISPYFLECISYKFDSTYMALAVLAAVFPLLFLQENKRIYLLTVILSTLVSCLTYQASLGIFPLMILFISYLRWLRGEKTEQILRLIGYSAAGYLISCVIYSSFMINPIDTYVSNEMYSFGEIIPGVLSNLREYYSYVLSDFDFKWLVFIGVLLISFVLQSILNSGRKKGTVAVVSLLTLACALCLAFGPYAALKKALYECRAMFGFGACIAMVAVICVNLSYSKIAKAMSFCLGWCFFVFAFVYGNALQEQQRYVDFRTEMVISDLADFVNGESDNPVELQITGTIGDSPILENMPQYDGVLGRLIQLTFAGDDWVFSTYYFCYYYDLNNANGSNHFTLVTDLTDLDLPLLYDGYYETIYGDGEHILIELKEY